MNNGPASATVGFVGAGNMARAIVAGLLRAGHEPGRLIAADPDAGQRARMQALDPGLRVTDDNAAAAGPARLVVLAVKPQVLADVVHGLPPPAPGQVILSIAAGVTLESLGAWFHDHPGLVRAMPNQPAMVGAGMAVLVAGASLDAAQRELAEYAMASTGATAWLDDESLLDAVTAVSGSGPAYFYLLAEILADCGRAMGLAPDLAALLARETAFGAGLAAHDTGLDPAELRRSVTSPGGTTAAALEALEQAGVRDTFRRALDAARRRSVELGGQAVPAARRS